MPHKFPSAATATLWFLALVVAFSAARYFLVPPPWLERTQILHLSRHGLSVLLHIAGGIIAMTVGLFQFLGWLRDAHPAVHRAMGYVYVTAVSLAGCTGLQLSPDTPVFAADGLTDLTAIDLSFLGLSPSFLGYSTSSTFSPNQFLAVRAGFTALALAWLLTTFLAFARARQRRFDEHRAWMMRSYSLTFSAATVRLVFLPFLVLMRDPVVAITCSFWSWVLNLMAVEWLIRRARPRAIA